MKKEIKKFLEFNGKVIYFVAADGQYWVALKPICEALGVNWDRQYKNLKDDENLKAVYAIQPMQAPDNQMRNYVALPEFFIYGWLFQIQSQSVELAKYKWECYRVLYEHFHGAIGGRKDLLKQKAQEQIAINQALKQINPELVHLIEKSQKRISTINGQLRKLDTEALEEEKTLFDT